MCGINETSKINDLIIAKRTHFSEQLLSVDGNTLSVDGTITMWPHKIKILNLISYQHTVRWVTEEMETGEEQRGLWPLRWLGYRRRGAASCLTVPTPLCTQTSPHDMCTCCMYSEPAASSPPSQFTYDPPLSLSSQISLICSRDVTQNKALLGGGSAFKPPPHSKQCDLIHTSTVMKLTGW